MIGLWRDVHRQQSHAIVRHSRSAINVEDTFRPIQSQRDMRPHVRRQRLIPLQGLEIAAGINVATKNIIARRGGQHNGFAGIEPKIKYALPRATAAPLYFSHERLAVANPRRKPDVLVRSVQIQYVTVNGIILDCRAILQ